MRVALSGSHRVGKTTLAGLMADALPHYDLVPEPYYLLVEDGNEFAEAPSVEDFELQLERSIQCIRERGADTIFDRCPLDMLGYLATHRDVDMFHAGDWLPGIKDAIASLDLVVFVPIETPDRIDIPRAETLFRADVDAALWDIIIDDSYGLGMEAMAVTGSPEDRLRQVLARLTRT